VGSPLAISHDDLIRLFNDDSAKHIVYTVRFTDGTTEEVMYCKLWGDRECIATVVRPDPGGRHSPGEEILFSFDEIAEAWRSQRGFDYYR
jgi:hypothetical protein